MLLVLVWIAFLTIQIVKTYAKTCSIEYWILNSLQVPIALSVTLYKGICLYTGKRTIASDGKQDVNWKVHQLFLYCWLGILAGCKCNINLCYDILSIHVSRAELPFESVPHSICDCSFLFHDDCHNRSTCRPAHCEEACGPAWAGIIDHLYPGLNHIC
ncbi:sulfite exporter TauE/SafE family protein 3-like [Aristolochia californica]|uniref:sulfite exporter TauE/SafE family protein 3-like n=1 Tax=Aristolochia californica TaxID=171875 RepID=UPI0035DB395C